MFHQSRREHRSPGPGLRTLIVGAGQAGRSIARDLTRAPEYGLMPVGFLDDDRRKRGMPGLSVLGRLDQLRAVAVANRAEAVIIAIPSLPSLEVRMMAEAATEAGVTVRFLPSFLAALERDVRISDLAELPLRRLIGRTEIFVARPEVRAALSGKRILVTGAGGSIGSELCRQLVGVGPGALYLLDHDESNLHGLQLELSGEALLDNDELIIADVRDQQRLRSVFAEIRPQVVFHAAAHKHLPLLERHPCEGVKTNVQGTDFLLGAAEEFGCERFVFISTDKAADPTSVLGATKRIAEMLVQGRSTRTMKRASVRFGNVLGSRGSLLYVIREQMVRGADVTITHPDVTRYFMTIEEAAGLVLEASAMADGGETYVLDMGHPVRIVDLVNNLARELHTKVSIRFTGLRPGEKLNEALFSDGEDCEPTGHPKITRARRTELTAQHREVLAMLYAAAQRNAPAEVRELLAELVPGYQSSTAVPALALAAAAPYPDGF